MREASTLQGDRVPHGQPLLKGQAKYSQRRQSRAERVRLQTHRLSLNLFGFGTSDLYTDLEEVSRAINGSTKDGLAVSETKSNFQGSRDSVALTSHGE